MPTKHDYYYCACSNDEYELTWFSGDSFQELHDWVVAMGDHIARKTILASPTGVCVTRNKMFKIMRVHHETGEIAIGALPERKDEENGNM